MVKYYVTWSVMYNNGSLCANHACVYTLEEARSLKEYAENADHGENIEFQSCTITEVLDQYDEELPF